MKCLINYRISTLV